MLLGDFRFPQGSGELQEVFFNLLARYAFQRNTLLILQFDIQYIEVIAAGGNRPFRNILPKQKEAFLFAVIEIEYRIIFKKLNQHDILHKQQAIQKQKGNYDSYQIDTGKQQRNPDEKEYGNNQIRLRIDLIDFPAVCGQISDF